MATGQRPHAACVQHAHEATKGEGLKLLEDLKRPYMMLEHYLGSVDRQRYNCNAAWQACMPMS